MASNGVKREEAASIKAEERADDAQVKREAKENKDSVKAEADGAAAVKAEASDEEQKARKVKQEENGRVKAETAANGVKSEEKVKKQEVTEVQAAVAASGDVKLAVRSVKRDVKKDEESKQQQEQEDRSHIRRQTVRCDAALWDSIEWSVAAGAEVDAGQRIGTAGRLEEGNHRPMQAPCRGRLYILTKEQSDELVDDKKAGGMRTVACVEYCIHPVRNGRTCLMCLAVVDDDDENEDMESVNVVSHGQVIRLNVEEAKKFDSDNIRRQLGAKKLSLVLDLDHTLLHAVRVDDVVGEIAKSDDIYFFFIPGLAQQHVVKLRPGLTEFLTDLSALYDLFIYTHGTRLYAEQIVKIIDPEETFFKNRIVARTDTPDMLHKSLKLLFPSCDDSMILVLDDRIDVWKENEGNVFLIEPYHYFKCTSEINNASGRGVAGMEDSEAEASEDSHLAQSTTVLKHVHGAFYAGHETGMRGTTAEEQMAGNGRDVKAFLSEQKRAILYGCRIVFSGVFPIVGPQSHESHYLWRLAVDLGATPSMTLTDFPLTHLVIHPERLGTQKHVQAKKIPGALVVTPDWILKCARSWSRVPEQDFLADEWKAKHTKKEPEEQAEDARLPAGASAPSETACGASAGTSGDADGSQPPPPAASAAEGKAVTSILLKREPGNAKRGKQVSFAKAVDDSENPSSEDGTEQRSKMVRRSRVIRRGASRARASAASAVATGVVATGGTFDFLSKINATKREPPRASVNAKKTDDAKKTPARPPPKDIDDAFLRLMEAEERETEKEEKRKHASTNIKDQLFSRRTKMDGKRSPESNPTAAKPDDKRMRMTTPSEQTNGEAENAEEEEDELDDLEADILGDL
ncbi:RNA polymerase II [Phytophthora pseudosyringae]|uniref:RNA polymerase II subunit A C-terminal domain phosphatase n=1 Tax=Phytophthora pseudosyringae TaxID=221518 RepID=A0A8T1W0I8_9STRA|nr:RNA polymerase II [Phytophthora pseudosyringae]